MPGVIPDGCGTTKPPNWSRRFGGAHTRCTSHSYHWWFDVRVCAASHRMCGFALVLAATSWARTRSTEEQGQGTKPHLAEEIGFAVSWFSPLEGLFSLPLSRHALRTHARPPPPLPFSTSERHPQSHREMAKTRFRCYDGTPLSIRVLRQVSQTLPHAIFAPFFLVLCSAKNNLPFLFGHVSAPSRR